MSHEPDLLLRLAGEISDGSPVAWEKERAAGAEISEGLERLRLVEAVALAHRQVTVRCPEEETAAAEISVQPIQSALSDRYILQRVLGQGGMATVFLAQDLKHGRPVAIKVLNPSLAAAIGPSRFVREIEIAARLQHPHILPLFDQARQARTSISSCPSRMESPFATGCGGSLS